MKKTIISNHVIINASKDKVWEAIADFGNIYKLSPNVAKSYSTTEKKQGVGAERHCDFTSMGVQVEERISEWNEGESMKIEIYQSKNMPMIKDIEAFFKVESQGDKTKLTGTFEYGMSNAIGNLLNSLSMKNMNKKGWVQFLAGIKHHVETGEEVDKKTKLDLSLVA